MKRFILAVLLATSFSTFAGQCDYPWDTDRAGNWCGDRAASERKGGR